jgi:hypothetical protein
VLAEAVLFLSRTSRALNANDSPNKDFRGLLPQYRLAMGRVPGRALNALQGSRNDMEIWTQSQMQSIHKMLNPRSIRPEAAVDGWKKVFQWFGKYPGSPATGPLL